MRDVPFFIKSLLQYLLVVFVVAGPSAAVVWDSTYEGIGVDHSTPSGSDSPADTPNFLKGHRHTWQFRMSPEHFVGDPDTLADDNGLHRLGSARCYVDTVAPDDLDDSHSGVSANIADHDNSTDTAFGGVATLADPATNSAGGAEDDVGHGRCWLDTDGPNNVAGDGDDNTLMVYIGQAGAGGGEWVDLSSSAGFIGQNLLFHSSFLATDGNGLEASTSTPIGWADVATPVHAYIGPIAGPIDPEEGVGYTYQATSNVVGEGIRQTLSGLKADTAYKVSVRAKADLIGTCRLSVTGGVTTPLNVDTTVENSFETLETTVTTTAVPANVVVNLLTQNAFQPDVCEWSNPTMVEITNRPQIGQTLFSATAVTGTLDCGLGWAAPCIDIVSVNVTPPGPGYIAHIKASVPVEITNGTCDVRIYDGAAAVWEVAERCNDPAGGGAQCNVFKYINLEHITTTPLTPGTTVNYRVDVSEPNSQCDVEDTVPSSTITPPAIIQVILSPMR